MLIMLAELLLFISGSLARCVSIIEMDKPRILLLCILRFCRKLGELRFLVYRSAQYCLLSGLFEHALFWSSWICIETFISKIPQRSSHSCIAYSSGLASSAMWT
jgi:hypothetical protein